MRGTHRKTSERATGSHDPRGPLSPLFPDSRGREALTQTTVAAGRKGRMRRLCLCSDPMWLQAWMGSSRRQDPEDAATKCNEWTKRQVSARNS